MRSHDDLKRREIQRAKNIAEKVNYRQAGHAFAFHQGVVQCVGCKVGREADWKGDYKYRDTAQKIVKEQGDCGKPFDLKQRIAEIEAQYAPKPQKTENGEEVTLETINAKLDKIIRRLGIW